MEEESVWLEAKKLMPASIGLYYRRAAGQHRPQKRQHRKFLQQMGRALRFYDRARCRQPAGGNDHGQNVAADGSQPRAPASSRRRRCASTVIPFFARIQQFAGKVYGPIVSAGLAYWQVGDSNYWGHNAVIRVKAFMECCKLPVLKGRSTVRRAYSQPRLRRSGRSSAAADGRPGCCRN